MEDGSDRSWSGFVHVEMINHCKSVSVHEKEEERRTDILGSRIGHLVADREE